MLTRPLAFKGPTDHLSQYFSLPQLYAGMGILLDDLLMEWQFHQDENRVEGYFLEDGQLKKSHLSWPLSEAPASDQCDCEEFSAKKSNRCIHLAALAIESKTRLERLPPPLKQQNHFANETAYLTQWISEQVYDPYPNMARHRVVYLLSDDDQTIQVSVHKAYLTQQNEYLRKDELELSIIQKSKLPKFISQTDQQILCLINDVLEGNDSSLLLKDNCLRLEGNSGSKILRMLLDTGRCFWKSCHRQPLSSHFASQSEDHWLALVDGIFLDKASSRVIILEALNNSQAFQLADYFKNNSDYQLTPIIRVTSESLYFNWHKQFANHSSLLELDIAKVSFVANEIEFSLEQILRWQSLSGDFDTQLIEELAGWLHQLDWMPGIASKFEPPVWRKFDIGDRVLEGDFSHWFILLHGLQKEGWQIVFDKQFKLNQKKIERWYSQVSSTVANPTHNEPLSEWFNLELGVVVDGHSVNVLPYIVEAINRGQWQQSELQSDQTISDLAINLADGTRIILEGQRLKGIIANLVELAEKQPLNEEQLLKLPNNQFARIGIIESQLGQKTHWHNADWLKSKAHRLNTLAKPKSLQSPSNVQAKLREYQKQGLAWLQALRAEGLAGILADDMGLGKTLQTLSHLQIEKNEGRMQAPALVIAPTSLLGNWVAEAKRFTPQLRVIQWSGAKRNQKRQQLASCDLIVTSYGVLLRDIDILDSLGLYFIILDEAQTIKNARSQIAKLTYSMQATHRLCLTGTPLENHLGELWSLFHFLMPGFLGDESQFKRLFQIPIEKENDRVRQKALSQRIAPFMLRRTKAKVATDLPAKTEFEELIDLTQAQADQYETVRLAMMDEIQKALSLSGIGKNQLLIGNALLRLRQICCHTGLVQGQLFDDESQASAKLNWLVTTLPEMIESGRRILLFSSFTSMLDLIAETLEDSSIRYFQLTGKTRNRSQLVNDFQAGKADVFLISLKAGGAGLNLTKADTVIHFDPWWNPAAESQASDRAHRIGQDKPVFIYKLISKGTVEERIQELQKRKAELANELYQEQETSASLKQHDWEALLAPIETFE
ncbi:DEAD/DEAH box helicase [Aliikangiella marina]|uniref:DEAD/DEAH box helicase n=1 Tax=Aliikangiella marina TaxID=1712262 RepID=A0A545T109_9GAMM|nr:DEAD/DEAH box helicase [Aliikangiella marina]TQV70903.1 DEAD/DEAH box helicase [Aliikangiella marina]